MIVPTYHRNDALRECLTALSPDVQTLPSDEYEVIVTDDGKTSTAEAMIKAEFPWAKWTQGAQRGPAANRNHGAKQAQGQWFIFTDDDCVPAPGFIAGYNSAVAAQSARAYEGKTTCEEGINSPLYGSPTNFNGGCFWSCNIMMQRDLFFQMGGFDEGFTVAANEDTDLRERLKQSGQRIVFAEAAVVNHPPRRMNLGTQAGRLRETLVRMWYMTGNHSAKTINTKIIKSVVADNVRRVRQYPLSIDSLRSLGYSAVELWYVCTHLSVWHRKYEKSFADTPAPYHYPY